MSTFSGAETPDPRRERLTDGLTTQDRLDDRPDGGSHRRRARLGHLVSAVAAPLASLAALRLLYGAALHAWPPGGPAASSTVDEVVLGLLSWAAVALCAWLALGVVLTALTRIPGRIGGWVGVLAERVTPAVVRRSLAMLVGVSVSTVALPTGTASGAVTSLVTTGSTESTGSTVGWTATDAGPAEPSPAFVPSHSSTPTSSPTATGVAGVDGPGFRVTDQHKRLPGPGWRPTAPIRTADQPSNLLTPPPRIAAAPIERLTVRRGDSLWSIAARHLGPGASDAEIAHEWPRWFAANAAVIGDDPDLILPGQQLAAPLEGARP